MPRTQGACSRGPVAMGKLNAVQKYFGYQMRRLDGRYLRIWNEVIDLDLTPVQFSVLLSVQRLCELDDQPVDQHAALEATGVERAQSSELFRRLEDTGWVTRHPDPHDGRRRTISLTGPAKIATEQLKTSVQVVQHRLLDPLNPEDATWVIDQWRIIGRLTEDDLSWSYPGDMVRRVLDRHATLWSRSVEWNHYKPEEMCVLVTAGLHPGISQTELARHVGLDRSTTSAIVTRLVKNGHVVRQVAEHDHRERAAVITEQGNEFATQLCDRVTKTGRRMTRALSKHDRERLRDLQWHVVETENRELFTSDSRDR